MYIYFEKEQFKILVAFLVIFVADTKIIFGYNFGSPLNFCVYVENVLGKEGEISVLISLCLFVIYFQNEASHTTVYEKAITPT